MGICGGYQMLGSRLSDPEGVEAGGQMRGMGLLEAETVFQGKRPEPGPGPGLCKPRESLSLWRERPLQAMKFIWAGPRRPCRPLQSWREAKAAGMGCAPGMCLGPMSTAFLTKGAFSRAFVNCILRSLGLTETTGAVDWRTYKERQYDALAQGVREALDMPYIYRLLGLPTGENRK